MNIAEINMTWCGSTGNIMLDIAGRLSDKGIGVHTYSARELKKNEPPIPLHSYYGTYCGRKINNLFGRIMGLNGLGSVIDTAMLVGKLKKNKTTVLHLHNLHSYCINFPILFRYVRRENIKMIWTLHDCWTFTGHCPHYDMIGCDKWQSGCGNCPQKREYPQSLTDTSRLMFKLKKRWFCGIKNMTLVTPSTWLASQVKQSFLKDYPVKVIHNGIDLTIFKPMPSDFRERCNIGNKYIILGVAFDWGVKKGLDIFVELANRLDKNKYQIVLVGTNDSVDRQLPDSTISIHRTHDKRELAEIYTASDVFVNPTREENFPTVNMEAIACGTPVITFRTGGCPEISDESCGSVVLRDDIDAMEKEIVRICETKPYSVEACLERAKSFNKDDRFEEYINLYKELAK